MQNFPWKAVFTADENGESVFVIENIGQTADNLYLDLEGPSSDGFFTVKIEARDEGNNQYYRPARNRRLGSSGVRQVYPLNLSGEAESLCVTVKTEAGEELIIKNVDINRIRPLDLSPVRIAATFFIIVVLWGLRPGAPVYAIKYNPKDALQTGLLICLMAAFLGGCIGISQGDPRYCDPPWAHHYQYHQLAVSLTEGHFYLDIEPSEDLMAMENPYDNNQRDADQVEFQWDTAYFNGKYYSYFGILPVFVYYLPYYLITGQAFPTYVGILTMWPSSLPALIFFSDPWPENTFPILPWECLSSVSVCSSLAAEPCSLSIRQHFIISRLHGSGPDFMGTVFLAKSCKKSPHSSRISLPGRAAYGPCGCQPPPDACGKFSDHSYFLGTYKVRSVREAIQDICLKLCPGCPPLYDCRCPGNVL